MTLTDPCGNAQAYHNELVGKVSRLEEENTRIKKEQVGIFHLLVMFSLCFFDIDFYLYLYACLLLLIQLLFYFVNSWFLKEYFDFVKLKRKEHYLHVIQ